MLTDQKNIVLFHVLPAGLVKKIRMGAESAAPRSDVAFPTVRLCSGKVLISVQRLWWYSTGKDMKKIRDDELGVVVGWRMELSGLVWIWPVF